MLLVRDGYTGFLLPIEICLQRMLVFAFDFRLLLTKLHLLRLLTSPSKDKVYCLPLG